jgi:hypothetical protein
VDIAVRLVACVAALMFASVRLLAASDASFDGLDRLVWSAEPHARTSAAASMAVRPLGDAAEYRFTCLEDGGKSRGWGQDHAYEAAGLRPETAYTFTAEARNTRDAQPLRAPSARFTVTTRAATAADGIVSDEIELIPIMVNGDKDNRINIVVVNRWRQGEPDPYNRPSMRDTFVKDVRDVIEPAFEVGGPESVAPFADQRAFYNVYALWWPNIPPWDPEAYDRGERAAHWETYNELRSRLFLPWSEEGRGWVTHMAMVNSRGGGGGAGLRLEERVGDAMIEGNEIDAFYHEFAHTALRLGDKYIGWGMWGRADESSNTTLVFQRDKVKWRKWIDATTPVPTPYRRAHMGDVGLFEGGTHRAAHIFRATPVCTMGVNQFSAGLCVLCVQEAAQRTYEYVDPLEDPRPAREELVLATPGTARFSVSRVRSTPDTQHIIWTVNGRTVAEDVDEVEIELGAIAAYEVVCSLVDRSPHIREDPPFARFPRAERRWRVANPNPTAGAESLRANVTTTHPSMLGANDGALTVDVAGGVPPYAAVWSNGSTRDSLQGLDEGHYSVRVVDAEFRAVVTEADLVRPGQLRVSPNAQFEDGTWTVTMDVSGVDDSELTCKWSTGGSGMQLRGVGDGAYGYAVTHATGAEVTGEIALVTPQGELAVAAELTPSAGANNGEIHLTIEGGREPYTVAWADSRDGGNARRFLAPAAYTATVRDANDTVVAVTATVEDVAPFELSRPEFTAVDGAVRAIDAGEEHAYLWYADDVPSYILTPPRGVYEGTFTTADGRVFEADGAVIPNTNGKWANPGSESDEHNQAHNDHGSWARLDAYVAGRSALPLTVKLETDDDGRPWRRVRVHGDTVRTRTTAEITGEGTWRGVAEAGRLTVEGDGPDGGRFDLLYTARHEDPSAPVHVGRDFRPPASGTYYVAARRVGDGAISHNRVGIAVQLAAGEAQQGRAAAPVAPDAVTSADLLMWLDASDMDGDGVEDAPAWPRGSLLGWRGKPGPMSATSFVIYEPNVLNGRPVADWQYIWLQSLEEPVTDYQTMVMVYRDHDLSKPGSGPWQGVDACLWDLTAEAAAAAPDEFRDGRAWLNGRPVDPYATPAPTEFCIATFEFARPSARPIARTHTDWEGAVAEFIAYDGPLTATDREGIEEHLRRKWLAAVTLTTQ